jgi:hypothetical protein
MKIKGEIPKHDEKDEMKHISHCRNSSRIQQKFVEIDIFATLNMSAHVFGFVLALLYKVVRLSQFYRPKLPLLV